VALGEPCASCDLPSFAGRMVPVAMAACGWLLPLHGRNDPKPDKKKKPLKALVQNGNGMGERREKLG